ncbi:MAG: hypothetical protein R6U27_06460, partial [Desulfobacterales bacterium]
MCGIVGYFGRAANSLTRVLTAMSAIIYRAPDSTGIGVFGDENEPLRTRKTVGSVINRRHGCQHTCQAVCRTAKISDYSTHVKAF